VALLGQEAAVLEAAGAGLVDELQNAALAPYAPHGLGDGLEVAADHAEVPDLAGGALRGHGDVDRLLVDIEPHVGASLFHGLPPSSWLCAG
jgi:hypothetical protein